VVSHQKAIFLLIPRSLLRGVFIAVLHYDLVWNPTRHEQREGRVDRFGQPDKVVSAP
jgi:hypothetical protein